MALETSVTYTSQLVETNPTASDNVSEGDDHIRLIKAAIKTTFPQGNAVFEDWTLDAGSY